jgi:catechol 2,3-dioxygenase-like lactoylglutathione lyase family enzyme
VSSPAIFNHVGLCVSDLERSRRFYELALGFRYWYELQDLPEESSARLLGLDTPLGLTAVYLVLDGFVLELLGYHPDRYEAARTRSMGELGLTHISVSVTDIGAATARAVEHGGQALPETDQGPAAMIRDPDGQLIELLDAAWRDTLPPLPA